MRTQRIIIIEWTGILRCNNNQLPTMTMTTTTLQWSLEVSKYTVPAQLLRNTINLKRFMLVPFHFLGSSSSSQVARLAQTVLGGLIK